MDLNSLIYKLIGRKIPEFHGTIHEVNYFFHKCVDIFDLFKDNEPITKIIITEIKDKFRDSAYMLCSSKRKFQNRLRFSKFYIR